MGLLRDMGRRDIDSLEAEQERNGVSQAIYVGYMPRLKPLHKVLIDDEACLEATPHTGGRPDLTY